MSKSVNTDHEFLLIKYVDLLTQAKGGRSQTEFAKDCGLSTAYICKCLNGRMDKAPIPSTIKKIAAVAANGVSYEDLLDAAGYDVKKYTNFGPKDDSNDTFGKFWGLQLEKLATATITTALSKSNLKWSIIGDSSTDKFFDMHVEIKGNRITDWFFCYVFSKTKDIPEPQSSQLKRMYTYYGHLATVTSEVCTMYSFVTDNEEIYDLLTSRPPAALAMYISVILIDVSSLSVIREDYIKTAFSNPTDNIMPILLPEKQ